jgi:Ni/Fe-hydrogenase 1 B-type cytochrome subunit
MTVASEHAPVESVYVWEWPVRLSHWLVVLSIIVLSVTGVYIGNPFFTAQGEATRHFIMGSMKAVHFAAAMVFLVSVLARIAWMFAGNPYARWHQFIPTTKQRLKKIWETFAFYVFIHRDSPAFVGHNPLAGTIYTVVFMLYFVMITTGLAMASANAHIGSILESFQFMISWFGGLQMARFIHHVGMWLILAFAAHHVWSAFLVATVERSGLIDSIFTGYKVLRPDIAERARKHIEDDR